VGNTCAICSRGSLICFFKFADLAYHCCIL
jgi:hypothetical protein